MQRDDANELTLQQARGYLSELQRRLLICLSVLVVLFCVLLPFANPLYQFLAAPLVANLPTSVMIATALTSPLLVPIKLALYCAFLLSAPVLIYQIWAFFSPALYPEEQSRVRRVVLPSVGLFYLGLGLAYQFVFPLLFSFLVQQAPEGVVITPEINAYLSLSMKLLLVFGLCFQVPLVTFILCQTGVVSVQQCAQARGYLIVAAFVFGMLLTPPDVISQIMVAVPIWLLFEIGLLAYRIKIKLRSTQ